LEAGHWKPQIRPLPVGLLADEIVNEWAAVTPGYRFRVRTPKKSPWAWGDEKEVRVVLNNFLDNAVKYSPAGTQIEVTITREREGYVTTCVEDQGIGISPEHQVKIFERFYRIDGSDAQRVYGHGLGLYVAKRLVEGMGGQIWVESEPGVGTRVAFTLPVMEDDDVEEDLGD
jgi:signal transduction histidine kinase